MKLLSTVTSSQQLKCLLLYLFTFLIPFGGCANQFDLCPENSSSLPLPICKQLPASGSNNTWYLYNRSDTVFVFVHGIFSDSRSAWLFTNPSNPNLSAYWPELVATDDRFGRPSVFLGGFSTTLDSGSFNAHQASNELFEAISVGNTLTGRVLDKRNLVFVTHSTGGIIVRHLLYNKTDHFKDKNVGLVLMASPSYGSTLADTLGLIAELYNNQLAKQLQWGNSDLAELDRNFKDLVWDRKIQHLTGCEAFENHFIAHSKWLPFLTRSVIVNEESAARYFASGIMIGGSDHFSIVKPPDINNRSHTFLVSCYQQYFRPLMLEGATPNGASPNSRKKTAIVELKNSILILRGDFETRKEYPSATEAVRHKAFGLGELLKNIDDESLDLGYQIIKYEYSALAYVMAASVETKESSRLTYATQARDLTQDAIQRILKVKSSSAQGDSHALKLSQWLTDSNESDRCHYIKAIALAISLRSGGTVTKEEIQQTIDSISSSYLEAFPLETNADLKAVLP